MNDHTVALMLTRHDTSGRFENVHSFRVLWDLRHYSTDGAEYGRGTSCTRRTTAVRRGASKFLLSLDVLLSVQLDSCPIHYLQLRSVLNDIDVAAIKTGMLANADVVRATARMLKAFPSRPPLVIDPVCVSTSGHTLLEHDALGALITELLPLATVLTPNASEAALLLQTRRQVGPSGGDADPDTPTLLPMASIQDMLGAAHALCALGPRAVLLKGGHVTRGAMRLSDVEAATNAATALAGLRVDKVECDGLVQRGANMEILFRAAAASQELEPMTHHDEGEDVPVVVDVLCEVADQLGIPGGECGGTRCTLFVRPYLDSTSTHGTGCTLSAALACALARGLSRTLFISRSDSFLNSFRCVRSR